MIISSRGQAELRKSSYSSLVGAPQAVFVESDLFLILSSHLSESFCQFILVLLLPARVHLHQPGLITLPGLLHFLQQSIIINTAQTPQQSNTSYLRRQVSDKSFSLAKEIHAKQLGGGGPESSHLPPKLFLLGYLVIKHEWKTWNCCISSCLKSSPSRGTFKTVHPFTHTQCCETCTRFYCWTLAEDLYLITVE